MNTKNIVVGIISASVLGLGFSNPAQANLINYNFEEGNGLPSLDDPKNDWQDDYKFLNESDVPGWQTTDSHIEIWESGFLGVEAADGDYFAEINAHNFGSLFQEVSDISAGQQMGFSFFHRARQGTDVMNLAITDLGVDNVFGTLDDTVLFTKDYSATTEAWVLNTSENEDAIMTLGNTMRFAYTAVSTGSGNKSVGNFLDVANFGLASEITPDSDPQDVPEPVSALAILAIGAISVGGTLRKKQTA
jgi:hypothetical protein